MNVIAAPLTLADTLPRYRWQTATLVIGGALATAAAAQVRIPLGFTPVPVTGSTFAVVVLAATLGLRRALASQGLYLAMAAVGLPVFANWNGGWDAVTGATGGYVVGYLLAAALVGHLAERGQDRSYASSVSAMVLGHVAIYTTGVAWLAHSLSIPVYSAEGTDAVTLGLAPFVIGDLVKVLVAAAITPALWAAVQRRSRS